MKNNLVAIVNNKGVLTNSSELSKFQKTANENKKPIFVVTFEDFLNGVGKNMSYYQDNAFCIIQPKEEGDGGW